MLHTHQCRNGSDIMKSLNIVKIIASDVYCYSPIWVLLAANKY